MKKSNVFIISLFAISLIGYCEESKVQIVGDTVISKDASVPLSQGNLKVEGDVTVGNGAIELKQNGDVIITGRVILKNPNGGISMGAYGSATPLESTNK